MSNSFYPKLAFTNIKKNAKNYIPYVLACIGTIMMFYVMHSLAVDHDVRAMRGGENLKLLLSLGTTIIGIFSVIFLFYTNSFLIKRRKKELGLYNILGLGKRHIAKMMFFETLFIGGSSLLLGILGGMLASKLMFVLLLRLLQFPVSFGFNISISSIAVTVILFGCIFLVTLLFNLLQLKMSNPIELLKGNNHGEREPKTKWLLTLIGIVTIATGYTMAQTIESPLDALTYFFVAVILVIIGTYSLFTAGSIALLKLLRKNKGYYYQTKHFTSISGMIYRMKQNAVGLANICILSTAVLVMLSSTLSLYLGVEDCLKSRFPQEIAVEQRKSSDEEFTKTNQVIETTLATDSNKVQDYKAYRYYYVPTTLTDNTFSATQKVLYGSDMSVLTFMSLSDYNIMNQSTLTLNDDEVYLCSPDGPFNYDSFTLEGYTFHVKDQLTSKDKYNSSFAILHSYYIVVNDLTAISPMIDSINQSVSSNLSLCSYIGFDYEGTPEERIALSNRIDEQFKINNIDLTPECRDSSRDEFLSMYGGLFFIGIFLGVLFLMATVLIIYYKQVSEGYEDKDRFEIMQKVGMSLSEVKTSIRNQVLMVFFLPLLTAAIHIAFAFKMIQKLLAILNLTNVNLFMLCTLASVLIFGLIYTIVYAVTARSYYKIVKTE